MVIVKVAWPGEVAGRRWSWGWGSSGVVRCCRWWTIAVAEVARRLGVTRQSVHRLSRR